MKHTYYSIPLTFCLGKIVADAAAMLRLGEEHLARHMFVGGGTGGGKSKLLEKLVQQLVAQGAGVTVIDPHGDLTTALLTYLMVRGVDPARVHLLAPGPDRCCSLDPFADIPEGLSLIDYEARLTATCDRIISSLLRNVSAAERELMKRLRRWLFAAFFTCGYRVGGRYAGVSKALVVLDPDHPEFGETVEPVRPYACRTDLGREVMLDLDKLIETKNARQREQWVESSMNKLREFLGPVMRQVFGGHAPAVSQRDIILNRGIQFVNVAKSDYLSREQGQAFAGIVINSLMNAAENIGRERPYAERVPHYLLIDECENFIGDDLRAGFGELRKYRLVLVIAFQDLSCLSKGELQLGPKVVSQCAIWITFAQNNPDDVEYLGKSFAYGSLDFTPLLDKRIVPDGYDYVLLPSVSVGEGHSVTDSTTRTVSKARARSRGTTEAEGINASVSRALSLTHADGIAYGQSATLSHAHAQGRSESQGDSETETDTESSAKGKTHTDAVNDSHGKSGSTGESFKAGAQRELPAYADYGALDKNQNRSAGWNDTHGSSRSDGTSETETKATARGKSSQHNEGETETWTDTDGRGESLVVNSTDGVGVTVGAMNGASKSKAKTASESEAEARANGTARAVGETKTVTQGLSVASQARHREEVFHTGSLKRSVQDQISEVMNMLASLPDRVVLVKVKGMGTPFLMRITDVLDPYVEAFQAGKLPFVPASRAWRDHELSAYVDRVFAAHRYNFVPDQERADEPITVDARAGDEDTVLA